MTSSGLPSCPFVTNGKITDRQFFIGRRDLVDRIIHRIQADQPTSINLVGDRQIGKSSEKLGLKPRPLRAALC